MSAFEEPIELETGEMPEWLGEVLAGEPPLSEEWAESEVAAPADAEVLEEQIPDWLRDFREREVKPRPSRLQRRWNSKRRPKRRYNQRI